MNISHSYPVIILAGGLATRLRPLTQTLPKALIPICNEPFIAHQLRLLKKNGIQRVVLSVGYLGDQIENFVGNGKKYGLSVTYVYDGPTLLGTAGAIKKALPLLDENFFVLYGDSYLPCNYLAAQQHFMQCQQLGLMSVFKNDNHWDNSNVHYAQGEIINYDKKNRTADMHYIDYGLGIFHKNAFANLNVDAPYDLADLYQELLHNHQLAAFLVTERFYEVGSFKGIQGLENYLNLQIEG